MCKARGVTQKDLSSTKNVKWDCELQEHVLKTTTPGATSLRKTGDSSR